MFAAEAEHLDDAQSHHQFAQMRVRSRSTGILQLLGCVVRAVECAVTLAYFRGLGAILLLDDLVAARPHAGPSE